jgi:rfaE bifunctional protein nucleotidyltransferase chain/domain
MLYLKKYIPKGTNMKIVVTSGYFDPLHVGHLEYLEMAKNLGDKLVVIINSDLQAKLKKGKPFIKEQDRMKIVAALRCVDDVFLSIDKDKSQCESLKYLKPDIFAKGGDRTSDEIPEARVCKELGIQIIDGLGAKIRSSSDLTGIKEIK